VECATYRDFAINKNVFDIESFYVKYETLESVFAAMNKHKETLMLDSSILSRIPFIKLLNNLGKTKKCNRLNVFSCLCKEGIDAFNIGRDRKYILSIKDIFAHLESRFV
jgi:hypothetical protein